MIIQTTLQKFLCFADKYLQDLNSTADEVTQFNQNIGEMLIIRLMDEFRALVPAELWQKLIDSIHQQPQQGLTVLTQLVTQLSSSVPEPAFNLAISEYLAATSLSLIAASQKKFTLEQLNDLIQSASEITEIEPS